MKDINNLTATSIVICGGTGTGKSVILKQFLDKTIKDNSKLPNKIYLYNNTQLNKYILNEISLFDITSESGLKNLLEYKTIKDDDILVIDEFDQLKDAINMAEMVVNSKAKFIIATQNKAIVETLSSSDDKILVMETSIELPKNYVLKLKNI